MHENKISTTLSTFFLLIPTFAAEMTDKYNYVT